MTVLEAPSCRLRPFRRDDAGPLVALAGDADVARYLGPAFPNPYLRSDAHDWIDYNLAMTRPVLNFAIEVDGALAGGIGLAPGDQIYSGSAMAGYWLGKPFWHRGLAADALRAITAYGFDAVGLRRIWAGVMAPNAASMRVLEKAGYVREAVLRDAVVDRFGTAYDEIVYARLR